MKNCSDYTEEIKLLGSRETDDIERRLESSPFFVVVDPINFPPTLVEVLVILYASIQ